jgi:hypothetical protein
MCLYQVHLGDVPETAGGIRDRSRFVGKCFNVNKSVLPAYLDGLCIQTIGLKLTTFQASKLGAHQGGAALDIFRAIFD